jgi:hypothetical protein
MGERMKEKTEKLRYVREEIEGRKEEIRRKRVYQGKKRREEERKKHGESFSDLFPSLILDLPFHNGPLTF